MSDADPVVWHVHRSDWHPDKDTVRGAITGTGGQGGEVLSFHTVERLGTLIPAGDYECKYDYWYGGSRPTYEIIWPWDEDGDGQPDRDRLLFHPANAIRNKGGEYILMGCIAMGRDLGTFWGPGAPPTARDLPGVTNSVSAFNEFMRANTHEDGEVPSFTLRITEEGRDE